MTISGFVVDPDRKKMSKSKGNVVVPTGSWPYGADAVRLACGDGPPRNGLALRRDPDEGLAAVLAMKVLNASKFVGMAPAEGLAPITPTNPL